MKRILFVDDEQPLLDGLRNALRRQRRVWDMAFACGGQAALALLEQAPFDVIVSDMRMPGMDGAELLQRVKGSHPGMVRIVLSGHAEREAVLRVLPVAQQYLSKPCSPEEIRSTIERAVALQSLLRDESIRAVVGRIDRLPSAPAVYWELTRAVGDPHTTNEGIAEIVARDPAMSTKVLQLVNSSYFGLAERTTSIQRAVTYLGVEFLRALALTAQVFVALETLPIEGFSVERLQRYSLLTARVARLLVGDTGRREEAFTAALVHDIGKVVLALCLPERLGEIVRTIHETGRRSSVVEQELIGVTHAEVGAHLLATWGLPHTLVEAVAYHHRPGAVGEGACDVLAAVHVADALVDASSSRDERAAEELDAAFLERAGLAARLPAWRAIADREAAAMRKAG